MEKIAFTSKVSLSPTDRDRQLLSLLSQCGVIKPAQATIAYGNVKEYHLRRIQKLVNAGILVRDHGYIKATETGFRLAGISGKPLRLKRRSYEEHSLAVDLVSQLPEWTPVYARELKQKSKIQRSSRACVSITRDNVRYMVYVIASEPRPATARFILDEMTKLRLSGIDKVLVFCTSNAIAQVFGAKPPDHIKECCILPYPQGIESFKRLFTPEFHAFLKARFPGITSCNRNSAHFEWHRALITVMIHNDLVKRAGLVSYIKSVQKISGWRCIAICSPGQEIDIPGVETVYDDS